MKHIFFVIIALALFCQYAQIQHGWWVRTDFEDGHRLDRPRWARWAARALGERSYLTGYINGKFMRATVYTWRGVEQISEFEEVTPGYTGGER